MQIEGKTITDTRYLLFDSKGARKFTITYVSDVVDTEINLPDAPPIKQKSHGAFHGQTLQFEKTAGVWKKQLLDAVPTPKQQRELQSEWVEADLCPNRRLEIGESWEVDASTLRRLLGGGDMFACEGKMRCTLDSIQQHKGSRCALILASLNVRWRMLDDENQEVVNEMSLSGSIYRSLSTLIDVDSYMRGQFKQSGSTVVEGEVVSYTIAGPVSVRCSQHFTRLKGGGP